MADEEAIEAEAVETKGDEEATLLEAAAGEQKKLEAEGPYRPDGLPEHFAGENDRETLDRVFKAYQGARKELSKGREEPPANADGYDYEEVKKGLPEGFELQADDPVYKITRDIAHKHGMTKTQFTGFVGDWLGTLVKEGVIGGEEVDAVAPPDPETEMRLVGKAEGASDQRALQVGRQAAAELIEFVNTRKDQGFFTAEEVAALKARFYNDGQAIVLLRKFMREAGGGSTIPTSFGDNDAPMTAAEFSRRQGADLMSDDPAKVEKALRRAGVQ